MKIQYPILTILLIFMALASHAQTSFLHASGQKILNGNDEEVILRGMGMGGWMLQEGYMLETADFAGTQHEIRKTLENTVGEDATDEFYESWRENYCTKADVDSMAAWGFNSIRLPIHYNLFTLPIEEEINSGNDTWINTGFEMIDQLLEWCKANKIYLIIDLHAAPGGQGKDANISDYDSSKPSLWESSENRRKTVALWKKLAERYANNPWVGGYDLLNEPNWDIDNAGNQNGCSCNQNTALWNFYKELIKAVRTVDNNHLLIIEGNCWGNNYNGLGDPKKLDSNLALSFHKYWSYNDYGSIEGIVSLRSSYNVPIWMGESGENSNTWFTNAIRLVESYGIGWAWWPYKKIGSVTGTITIPKTTGWQKLLDYWKGNGSKPSEDQAYDWMMEQADMLKLENCTIHRDVLDAMFRQINSTETLPFKNLTVPGTIYAVDYDLGPNGFAYSDSDTANYKTTTGEYSAWNSGYSYRNDGVDIEACTDAGGTNGYDVGWTTTGEWLQYTVITEQNAAYSIDLRYAALWNGSKIHFEQDGVPVTTTISLPSTGGWTTWGTTSINNVVLKKGKHKLKLCIDNAGFNINFFKIHTPVETGSVTPEILNICTNTMGDQIRLATNLGYDMASLPSSGEFKLTVNNSEKSIETIHSDETNPEVLVLQTNGTMIASDQIYLTYSGESLKTADQRLYDPFDNREVENDAPEYFLLPGKIEAEDFSYNSGFQTETCSDAGGGSDLGYASSGDYADYDVYVSNKGTYEFNYRVASLYSGKFELRQVKDGKVSTLHSINVPVTGGWQVWKTLSSEATLEQGKNTLRYYAVSGEFNLNWISASALTSINTFASGNDLDVVYRKKDNSLLIRLNKNSDTQYNFSCYDLNGRQLFHQPLDFNGNTNITIQNSPLKKGIYIVRFKSDNQIISRKLRVI